ncbi:MAG: respiratory nitrate reductase subunit gamma [Desulfobacula sp.]|nr:respiratory nitrate reductase subunit gamma [Desulfobacula sp.]
MNYSFIEFIMGPMVWVSFAVFFIGLTGKTLYIILQIKKKESFIFSFLTLKHSTRSIIAWLIPFFPKSTRTNPVFYMVSYLFHIGLFLVPLFLMSHIVLGNESFQISWVSLNDTVADWLTVLVIMALGYFAYRRASVPQVRYLTTFKDYLLLLMVALPFITGFLANHQVLAYKLMIIAHVISGELMLIMIPFTKFSHIITGPLSRAYTGSEFGNVRHAKDW